VKQELVGEYVMDDTVIIETVLRAIHVGPYMGIPPSNKPFEMPTLHVFNVKNGRITAWRQYQNFNILADLHNR
jgi:ketosteroid isomerase-like protein